MPRIPYKYKWFMMNCLEKFLLYFALGTALLGTIASGAAAFCAFMGIR